MSTRGNSYGGIPNGADARPNWKRGYSSQVMYMSQQLLLLTPGPTIQET
jgi:hypothetical protein